MRFVSYLRVSTDQQGREGLGIAAQRQAVADHAARAGGSIIGEHVEVESGKRSDRPALAAALAQCRLTGAALIVGKLDRLARNARFLLSVVEGAGENGVVFCDLPAVPAGPVGRFLVTQMAAVAELEAGMISARTKAALAQAKARGVKLGGYRGHTPDAALGGAARAAAAEVYAQRVAPLAAALRNAGGSYQAVADGLAAQGVKTPRGGAWTAGMVRNVLLRAEGRRPRP